MITEIMWLLLFVVFLLIEANMVVLVPIWFACGALAALGIALMNINPGVQIIVFVGISVMLLALLRPFLRKYITPKLKINEDSVIGLKGIVTVEINNRIVKGQVKLGNIEFAACSTDGSHILPGTQVTVDKMEGVLLFVSPVKSEAAQEC